VPKWLQCSIGQDVHVMPIDDLIEHVESETCVCRPRVRVRFMRRLIVHFAADGREYFENGGACGREVRH
jgi:hypothetical protein